MRFFKGLFTGVLFMLLVYVCLLGWNEWSRESIQEESGGGVPLSVAEDDHAENERSSSTKDGQGIDAQAKNIDGQDQMVSIGMSGEELEEQLGKPDRTDPSAYGYEWWIYKPNQENYIQVGVQEDQVVTFYTNAPGWSWQGLASGMTATEWKDHWEVQERQSFHHNWGYYTFQLSAQDIRERPVQIDDQMATQLYVDIHDENKISGIRVMDLETLLLQRPYALQYVGQLPETPQLSTAQWQEISQAYEQQILDMVNVTREVNGLPSLEWHEETAAVARSHSRDMQENDYFDHYSPRHGDLGDRLDQGEVTFRGAGENIAWNYVDAADVHHGWLNSPGHRKNLMEPDFTHLGVGVVRKYYTQNFIQK